MSATNTDQAAKSVSNQNSQLYLIPIYLHCDKPASLTPAHPAPRACLHPAHRRPTAYAPPGHILSFLPRADGSSPQHQPGRLATEADKAGEEFHAQTLPAGTAPKADTYAPQTTQDVLTATETTSAQDTITGATSGDVHMGHGHPGSGQSSNELHHDGGKTHGGSLQGVGAKGATSEDQHGSNRVDMSSAVPGATQKATGE